MIFFLCIFWLAGAVPPQAELQAVFDAMHIPLDASLDVCSVNESALYECDVVSGVVTEIMFAGASVVSPGGSLCTELGALLSLTTLDLDRPEFGLTGTCSGAHHLLSHLTSHIFRHYSYASVPAHEFKVA